MDGSHMPPEFEDAENVSAGPSELALELARLAALPIVEFNQQRRAAASKLGMTVKDLEREVKTLRRRAFHQKEMSARENLRRTPGAVVWGPGFRMEERGLVFLGGDDEAEPEVVCAPFQILGETRSAEGTGWGRYLAWHDRDGKRQIFVLADRLLVSDPGVLEAALADQGLRISGRPNARLLLRQAIAEAETDARITTVPHTGWHLSRGQPTFILPGGEAFGQNAERVVLQNERTGSGASFAPAGTLQDWQEQIASYAEGNDRLALFLSAAFVGPLLDIASEPSGGFHLIGKSQSGKSTAAFVAGSVWGRGDRDAQVRQWRATSNGLEGVAAETSDTVLILDEMGQAHAQEIASIIYTLANNSGKARANRLGDARERKTWRTLFLSTGEVTLATKLAEAGKKTMAGLEVRLVNLPADAGAGMGLFQELHGMPSPAGLANHLRDAARTTYGTPARAFLTKLAKDRAEDAEALRIWISDERADFITEHVAAAADGQVRSVAGRFALVGAAGELAQIYGVLPWQKGEAMRAAGACFKAWVAERGGHGAGEDAQALSQVRAFIETHGSSRFELVGGGFEAPLDPRTVSRAGFRRKEGDGWQYLILPEAWRNEVCRGLDPKRAADTLAKEGFLLGSTERHRAATERVPGHGRLRVYVVSGAILEGGHD